MEDTPTEAATEVTNIDDITDDVTKTDAAGETEQSPTKQEGAELSKQEGAETKDQSPKKSPTASPVTTPTKAPRHTHCSPDVHGFILGINRKTVSPASMWVWLIIWVWLIYTNSLFIQTWLVIWGCGVVYCMDVA